MALACASTKYLKRSTRDAGKGCAHQDVYQSSHLLEVERLHLFVQKGRIALQSFKDSRKLHRRVALTMKDTPLQSSYYQDSHYSSYLLQAQSLDEAQSPYIARYFVATVSLHM